MDLKLELKKLDDQSALFTPIMKVMGCCSIVFSFIAGYVIIKYSTKQMGSYKWYLLNNVVSSINIVTL